MPCLHGFCSPFFRDVTFGLRFCSAPLWVRQLERETVCCGAMAYSDLGTRMALRLKRRLHVGVPKSVIVRESWSYLSMNRIVMCASPGLVASRRSSDLPPFVVRRALGS